MIVCLGPKEVKLQTGKCVLAIRFQKRKEKRSHLANVMQKLEDHAKRQNQLQMCHRKRFDHANMLKLI